LQACENGALVFPCPDEIVSDDTGINMDCYSIQGDKLVLDLRYGGGQGMKHDFGVCYEEGFAESDPVQGTLRLLHDAHEDGYRGIIPVTLTFDLGPYADYYNDLYQAVGGLIATNYGMYAFGTLTCDERDQAVSAQTASAVGQLSQSCSADADCEYFSTSTACSSTCGTIGSTMKPAELSWTVDTVARLSETLDAISASVCGDYNADGCGPVTGPTCGANAPLVCLDGVCQKATGDK
jgi:hypothetical protein